MACRTRLIACNTRAALAWLALCVPAPVSAQSEAGVPSLDTVIHRDNHAIVKMKDGSVRKGRVLDVSPKILLLRGDIDSLAAADIASVTLEYRDPLRNGLRNGALIGFFSGLATAVVFVVNGTDHHWFIKTALVPLLGMVTGPAGMFIGVGVGVSIDALRLTQREVWRAPPTASTFGITGPIQPGAVGARLAIRW